MFGASISEYTKYKIREDTYILIRFMNIQKYSGMNIFTTGGDDYDNRHIFPIVSKRN